MTKHIHGNYFMLPIVKFIQTSYDRIHSQGNYRLLKSIYVVQLLENKWSKTEGVSNMKPV